ncbi:MAG: hypothetical protein WDN26_04095 [Chitinophagaceae bacterium]
MENLFIIKENLENKLNYYHIAAFLVLLPFDRFYSELVLISFLFHTLIHSGRRQWRSVGSWQNLVLSSIFFLTVIGALWASDKNSAGKRYHTAIKYLPFSHSVFAF